MKKTIIALLLCFAASSYAYNYAAPLSLYNSATSDKGVNVPQFWTVSTVCFPIQEM